MDKEIIIDIENPKDNNLINRQALLKLMGEEPFNWTDSDQELQAVEDYRNFRDMVEQLPPVKPQERTGHWIYDDIANNWRCDKCGETPKTMGYVGTADFMSEHFRFCNHCGCRMVEPQESEG